MRQAYSVLLTMNLYLVVDSLIGLTVMLTKYSVNRVHSKGTTYDVDLVLGES